MLHLYRPIMQRRPALARSPAAGTVKTVEKRLVVEILHFLDQLDITRV
jgi:hypothetical protein